MSVTFSQIKGLIYKTLWQNTGTERYWDQEIVICMNAAWLELCVWTSISNFVWTFSKTLWAEWTNFDFWYKIKRIDEIRWYTTWISKWENAQKLHQVFQTPENDYEYQKIWTEIITYNNYLTLKFKWERYLSEIENTEASLNQVFPLWYLEMIIIMEFCLCYLFPVKISEWYNLSQYHRTLALDLKKTLSNVEWADISSRRIKNEII